MTKKRSIIITGAILAAITAASFSVWLIPQGDDSSFVVSDYRDHLESVKARHFVITDEIQNDLQAMLAGTVSPDNFIMRAEASSSQINSLIIELIQSGASQEWHESYLNYGESLKSYNSYLRETIVLANIIKERGANDIQGNLETLDALKKEFESFSLKSDETRP
ncbi:MAG TPA: hypothetical protein VLB45_06575 [Nitrosopumilaceae archaeon]|nr:hypothetical protein [Nitrosopumilaceae archaeon]